MSVSPSAGIEPAQPGVHRSGARVGNGRFSDHRAAYDAERNTADNCECDIGLRRRHSGGVCAEFPGVWHSAAGSDLGEHVAGCAEGHVHSAMEGVVSGLVDICDGVGGELFGGWLA